VSFPCSTAHRESLAGAANTGRRVRLAHAVWRSRHPPTPPRATHQVGRLAGSNSPSGYSVAACAPSWPPESSKHVPGVPQPIHPAAAKAPAAWAALGRRDATIRVIRSRRPSGAARSAALEARPNAALGATSLLRALAQRLASQSAGRNPFTVESFPRAPSAASHRIPSVGPATSTSL